MANGIVAFGTLLKRGDGASPEAFTTVAEITNISGIGFSRDTADMTHHTSPGKWEEVKQTIKRWKEIQFEFNYIPGNATHNNATGLLGAFNSDTIGNWQIVFPDATTWTVTAFVSDIEIEAPHDDKLAGSAVLRPTGQPTLA